MNPAPVFRWRSYGLFFGLSLMLGGLLTVSSAAFGWWRYGVEIASVWNWGRFSDAGFVVDAYGRGWEWTEQRRTATSWYRLWNPPGVVRTDLNRPTQEENSKDLVSRYGSPRECRAWKSLVEQKRYLWNFAAIDRIDVGWPARSFTLLNAWYADNPRRTGNKLWHGTDLGSGHMPDWIESLHLSDKFGTDYLPTSPLLPGVLISWGFWSVVAGAVLACPMAVRHARAVHRRRRGRCTTCGYDLRGLAGAACPECGGGGGKALVAGDAAAAR